MTPVKRYKLDTDVGLERQVADLTAKLAMVKRHAGLDCGDNSCMFAMKISGMRTNGGCRCNPKRWKQDLEESYARIADLTRRLEEAERSYDALSATRDALQAKLAAAEQERDTTRTALLALPVAQEALECAAYALSHTESNQAFALDVINVALLQLAQAMRGR